MAKTIRYNETLEEVSVFERLINHLFGERRANFLKDYEKQDQDLAECALELYNGTKICYHGYLGINQGNVDSWVDYKSWLLNWVSTDMVGRPADPLGPNAGLETEQLFNDQNQLCEFFIEWRGAPVESANIIRSWWMTDEGPEMFKSSDERSGLFFVFAAVVWMTTANNYN